MLLLFASCTYKAVGANVDSVGMWDNIYIRPMASVNSYLGNEPTIGVLSAEGGSNILPDLTGDDFTQLNFQCPSFLDTFLSWIFHNQETCKL